MTNERTSSRRGPAGRGSFKNHRQDRINHDERSIEVKKAFSLGAILFLLLLLAACDKSSPTSPSMPTQPKTATLQSITVSSANSKFKIGDSENFTATANMSDGTHSTITTGIWSTDNMSVATVVAGSDGGVIIVGSGTVNIVVTYNGMTGAKSIEGFLNCEGLWKGTYRIDSCNATGDFLTEGFCGVLSVGETLPVEFTLGQTGDSVSGTARHGGNEWPVVGQITKTGEVTLSGKYIGTRLAIDTKYVMQLQVLTPHGPDWGDLSYMPGMTSGTLHQRWTESDMTGYGEFGCTIVELSWLFPGTWPLNAATTRVLLMNNPTIEDMIRALRIR